MATSLQQFVAEQAIKQIADFIADPVEAADFPKHHLRFRNDRAALEIGLSGLNDSAWIAHFGKFEPLSGSLPQPLALRYHGHQFRVYNSDIGDGRGFLFAQCRDAQGRLMDLGTKGSGQTPYSRFGDGRLTLKGAVREILATEMLEALGVKTSRTLSVIETGESLNRGDEPSPTRSAVLVRLNHGHIRIGSFQRLASLGLTDELSRLAEYSLKYYFGETAGADGPVRLLTLVAQRAAKMAASYMAAGFVHGVLNSDNINITGESFDYGPWRFTPTFDAKFTAAYFDQAGLYSFGRQAEAVYWNVVQLGNALRCIADPDMLSAAIAPFEATYRAALVERMLWRLALKSRGDEADLALIQAMEAGLSESRTSIDDFFFDWQGGRIRREAVQYDHPAFDTFRNLVAVYATNPPAEHPYWAGAMPCSMLIDEVENIWKPIAEQDDWTALTAKIAWIRRMGDALRLANY